MGSPTERESYGDGGLIVVAGVTSGQGGREGRPQGEADQDYHTTWTSWQLNRAETLELAQEGADAAVMYAIAAVLSCGVCVVGAVIEGYWFTQANAYYDRGHCAEIKFWLAINEYSGSNCY